MTNYCAKLVAVLFLIVASNRLSAQSNIITISGKIFDALSGEPIPYANVYLPSASIGTVTNLNGEFVFKIPERLEADSVQVSYVGYKTAVFPLAGSTFKTIALQPASVVLKEVTVHAESALGLFKEALQKIPENYDTSAVHLTAFYSENYWLGDFELAFNESVLEIYKVFNFTKDKNDGIRIIKGRKKQVDFGKDAQFLYWISNISNTARSTLREDLVKYNQAKLTPFNPKNFRYYEYEYRETILDQGRNIIVIDIYPRKKSRKGYVMMKLYIDEESLAIVKVDIECTPAGVEYVNKHQKGGVAHAIMSKIVGATIDFSVLKVSLSYKEYNDKWYLSSVQRHWEALVNSKKRNMTDRLWRADMHLLITDIKTDSVRRFEEGDVGNNRFSLGQIIGSDYEEEFWENYNILKPISPDSVHGFKVNSVNDSVRSIHPVKVSNRQNGFTRADTLRGKLSDLRTCYDVTFYHLDVAIDMDKRSISGNNLIRFKTVTPFRKMQVDLYANMKINKIFFNNQPLPYTREFDAVVIELPFDLNEGDEEEIRIYYEGVPQVPDWSIPMHGGVLWDKDSLGNPWVQVVCQGSGASLWWPNKDHLSDEPDSLKIWITVPSEFTEISNGRLIRKTQVNPEQTRHEWFVSYPINNYNVTFNVGKYAHYSDWHVTGKDTLTIDYYVMAYNLERAKDLFKQVKPMLQCFEKHFGPYPFIKDGFVLVESLHAMEHQSGVCFGKIPEGNAENPNPLLWHESAHEWWGNAVSCKDMADLWIHEAFATYAESLIVECEHGKDMAQAFINDHHHAVRNEEPVIGVYDVNHIFYEIGDMYEKGMLILNTFRNVINDDAKWFELLRSIQHHFRYKTLTTNDLIQFINGQLKIDYSYFFDQYLNYAALPKLEIELTEKGPDLEVRYRWRANVPGFKMPVKVTTSPDRFEFIYPVGEWRTLIFRQMTSADFEVDEESFFIELSELY